MSEDLPITFSYGTDVGKVRDHNEDWVEVGDPADSAARRKGRLFIVADGMGGYQAGEVASRLAAESLAATRLNALRFKPRAAMASVRVNEYRPWDGSASTHASSERGFLFGIFIWFSDKLAFAYGYAFCGQM